MFKLLAALLMWFWSAMPSGSLSAPTPAAHPLVAVTSPASISVPYDNGGDSIRSWWKHHQVPLPVTTPTPAPAPNVLGHVTLPWGGIAYMTAGGSVQAFLVSPGTYPYTETVDLGTLWLRIDVGLPGWVACTSSACETGP